MRASFNIRGARRVSLWVGPADRDIHRAIPHESDVVRIWASRPTRRRSGRRSRSIAEPERGASRHSSEQGWQLHREEV